MGESNMAGRQEITELYKWWSCFQHAMELIKKTGGYIIHRDFP